MQFDQLRRRDFITLLGGAATWPLTTHAQQAAGKEIERYTRAARKRKLADTAIAKLK